MIVRAGDTVYDSEETPILLILTDEEKDKISNLDTEEYKFCVCPEYMSVNDVFSFMSCGEEDEI